MPRDGNSGSSRRRVLKATGAATIAAGVPAVATAQQERSAEEIYEAALRVREQTNSLKKFRNVLRRNNAKIATDDVTATKQWRDPQDSDGASTQKLQQADFSVSMTMTSINGSYPYVDFNWDITVDYDLVNNDGGEPPVDIAGMTWEPRDYDYDEYTYTGNATYNRETNYKGGKFEYYDITCEEYNDAGASCPPDLGTTVTVEDYAGLRVKPDETEDAVDRKVFGDFWHTWSDVDVEGVSIDSAGTISVTLSNNDKKWDSPVEAIISEDELEYEYCC